MTDKEITDVLLDAIDNLNSCLSMARGEGIDVVVSAQSASGAVSFTQDAHVHLKKVEKTTNLLEEIINERSQ